MVINKKAQSVSEYAIIVGLIGSALLMMGLYFSRSIQVVVKEPVDNLGLFGFMPVDIQSRSDLTQEEKDQLRAQRIQEIGIEDNVVLNDGQAAVSVPSESDSTFNTTRTTTTSEGGQRRLDVNENTNVSSQINRAYNRIEYDQVTRPNTPDHSY